MLVFLLSLVILAQGQYYDTTCAELKSTKEGLSECNYAKSLGYGNFTCVMVVSYYNVDGSLNATFPGTMSYETFYNSTLGAIVTMGDIGNVNQEYCGPKGGAVCLVENLVYSDWYTESYDLTQAKKRGHAARLIQSYEKNQKKGIRRVQHLVTRPNGDENVAVFLLDEDQNYELSVFATCTKVKSDKRAAAAHDAKTRRRNTPCEYDRFIE